MRLFVFAIRDRAIVCFMQPFTSPTKGGAERAFRDAINDSTTPMFNHPEDYDLYELGEFDQGTGLYDTKVPEQICCGKDVKAKPTNHDDLFAHNNGQGVTTTVRR